MPTKPTANGFIGRVGLGGGNATSYTGLAVTGGHLRKLRRMMNGSHGSRKLRAALLSLTGAAVGAASKAYSNARLKASETPGVTSQVGRNELGGRRTTETVAYQTGVSVASDLTDIDGTIAKRTAPTYPADRSGYRPGNINKLGSV